MSTSARSQGPTASERAYAWVKDRVLDGRLEGGRLLSEGDVAAEVGLSRTPVREAFLRLEVEGLIRLYPKRGALVVPISADELGEVTEARILLEGHAARTVISAGRGAEAAESLGAVLARQRELDVPAETAEFSSIDREFHATLVEAAGNSLITQFYSGLRDRQVRMSNTALHREPRRFTEILDGHAQICRLLAEGDPDGLAALLATHIGATHGALLDT